jgi:hypothetical protein
MFRAVVIAILATFMAAGAAFGQSALLQGGPFTPGRAPMYVGQGFSQPIVQDSGPAAGGGPGVGLSELGLTVRGTGTPPYANAGSGFDGTNFCDYDAPTTNPTGYHFFCISPNAQGGGLMAYGAAGGASALPFQFSVNGVLYTFPYAVGGIVGPATTVVGHVACWNNTVGTLLSDCGTGVVGTPNYLAVYNGAGALASSQYLPTGNFPALSGQVTNSAGSTTVNLAAGAAAANLGFTPLNPTTTQSPNTVYAGPGSGGSAAPTFRSLVATDIPTGIPAANSTYTQPGTGGAVETLQYRGQTQLTTPYDFGAVGTDTPADNAHMQNWLSQLNAGGALRLPCGVWQITTLAAITIPAGAHAEIDGDGQDCAIIHIAGPIDGPVFTYTNQYSSLTVKGVTFASDQAGTNRCLTATGSYTNANPALGATSSLFDVTFRGMDTYGAATQYCGVGFYESNISNINLVNPTYIGISSRAGLGVSLSGTGVGGTYSVKINLVNPIFTNCNTGVFYGDWVQGVQITAPNVVRCNFGVASIASPSGQLSELNVTGGQFDTWTSAINILATGFANEQINGNQFIVEGGKGIVVQGTNFTVSGNQVNGVTTSGTTGIVVVTTSGNGGLIGHNSAIALGIGYQVNAASTATVLLSDNQNQNNTTNYIINTGSSGTIVTDHQPQTYAALPNCNSATKYSDYNIANSNVTTFGTPITGAGAQPGFAYCDGTNLVFH